MNDYQLLHQLYATHAPTGCEWPLIRLVRDYLAENVPEAEVRMDGWGNLYITKGAADGETNKEPAVDSPLLGRRLADTLLIL